MRKKSYMTNNRQEDTRPLYPLKFQPILKPVIWGGTEISHFKQIEPVREGIGESWEISGVKNNLSVVANGPLAGTTIEELLISQKRNWWAGRCMKNMETFFRCSLNLSMRMTTCPFRCIPTISWPMKGTALSERPKCGT